MRVLLLLLLVVVLVQAAPSSPLIRTEERKRVDAEKLSFDRGVHTASDSKGPPRAPPEAQSNAMGASTAPGTSSGDTSAVAQTDSIQCHRVCRILKWGTIAGFAVSLLRARKGLTKTEVSMPSDGY